MRSTYPSTTSSVATVVSDSKTIEIPDPLQQVHPASIKSEFMVDGAHAQRLPFDEKTIVQRIMKFAGMTKRTATGNRLSELVDGGGRRRAMTQLLRFYFEQIGTFVSIFDVNLNRCFDTWAENNWSPYALPSHRAVCNEFKLQFWKAIMYKLVFAIARLQRYCSDGLSVAVSERVESHLFRLLQLVQNQLMLVRRSLWTARDDEAKSLPNQGKPLADGTSFTALNDISGGPSDTKSHVHKTCMIDEVFLLGRGESECVVRKKWQRQDDPNDESDDDEFDDEDDDDYERCHLPSAKSEAEALWRCQMMLLVLNEVDPFVSQLVVTGGVSFFAHIEPLELFVQPKKSHWDATLQLSPASLFSLRRVISSAAALLVQYARVHKLDIEDRNFVLRKNSGLAGIENAMSTLGLKSELTGGSGSSASGGGGGLADDDDGDPFADDYDDSSEESGGSASDDSDSDDRRGKNGRGSSKSKNKGSRGGSGSSRVSRVVLM